MDDEAKLPNHTPIPSGRLGRMARLGALAVSAASAAVRGKPAEVAAEHAAEVLGNLRGLAAKIGQMASYVDGVVPEDKRDAFERSLKVLRSQAPRSKPSEIRALVETELGAPIDQLFASWDDEPLASASIGQVHRARLHDDTANGLGGLEVAVKVQHPGVRKAVESDLASASVLESLGAALGGRRFDTKGNLEIIRERFREELDYELEASRVEAFTRIHEGDEAIIIPRVVRERSSKSVLTTEFVRGRALEDVANDSEDARRAFAETLWRFVFKGNLVGEMFNADPHPGNYLFQEDGRIAFLDFGCVQVLAKERHPAAIRMHRAAIERDERAFREGVLGLVDTKPGELEGLATRYVRLCFEPLFASPYRMTREYAASLVAGMKEMAVVARKLPIEQVFAMPPEMLFVNRLQFGFYSVLARLDVEVDYARVESAFLPSA